MTGMVWDPPLHPGLVQALHDTIGLDDPDANDPLHVKLVEAMGGVGSEGTLGQRIVAMRFQINWAHREAGKRLIKAKTAYDKALSKARLALLAEEGMSAARAEMLAETEEIIDLRIAFLLEQETVRNLKGFLESLDRSLENHRTDRADWRASDTAHAHGYSGGA